MSKQGASREQATIPEVGTVDEQAHRVVHEIARRYADDRSVLEEQAIWRPLNIVERMALVMRDVEHVGKTGDNREQHYKFRPIDEFMNALHTPLVKHEVVVTPRVLDRTSFERDRMRNGQVIGITRVVEMLVEFTFHSPDGTTLVSVTAGEGADVADKATNKAMAGALKYAIMQTFMVPTRELQDGDAETPELQSNSSAAQQQNADEVAAPPRDVVMAALDEACSVLGKTRAKLTEKWRQTYDVGVVANLDDESKVPTYALHRFVLSVQPFVQQARDKQAAETAAPADETDEQRNARVAQEARDASTCAELDGSGSRCVRPIGHDGDHSFWGAK